VVAASAFLRGEGAQHSAGDHDPAVVLVAGGDGERFEVALVDDDEASVPELPAFSLYVMQRAQSSYGRDGDGASEQGEYHAGRFCGRRRDGSLW
jgi:hypothetical protein